MQPSYDLASVARKVLSASRPKIIQHQHPEETKEIAVQTLNAISKAFDDEFSPFDFKIEYMGSWMNDENELPEGFDFNLHKLDNVKAKVDYFLVNFKNMHADTKDELASNINEILTEKYQINICDNYNDISRNLYIFFNNMNIIFKIIVMASAKFIKAKYKIFKPAENVNSRVYGLLMDKIENNEKASKIYTGIKSFSFGIRYDIDPQIFQIIKSRVSNGIYLLDLFERNSEQSLLDVIYKFTGLNSQMYEHNMTNAIVSS